MGGRWSGNFLSTYRNQCPLEAQNNLTEFYLKADGNTSLHLGCCCSCCFSSFLFSKTITVMHAVHARDIYICPRECIPFRYIHFSIIILKTECKCVKWIIPVCRRSSLHCNFLKAFVHFPVFSCQKNLNLLYFSRNPGDNWLLCHGIDFLELCKNGFKWLHNCSLMGGLW